MTSSFGWLDHSEQQRRQMLEIVNLFRDKGTLDELGIGVIRDAFADHFFPGTSTLQTRARYLLFIPWIFQRLESERIPSAQFDRRARQSQADLVRALVAGGESEGVIGIAARDALLRPPSELYWTALRVLGIFRFGGPFGSYLASLDQHYRADRTLLRSDDGELLDLVPRAWHAALPPAPAGLMSKTTFELTRPEADYLRERIVTEQRHTLLAAFATAETKVDKVNAPWEHAVRDALAPELRRDLEHGELFSLVIRGAYLLYNVMLADVSVDAGMTARERLPARYREMLAQWAGEMTAHDARLARWDLAGVWDLMASWRRPIPLRTRRFVEQWADIALHRRAGLAEDGAARQLIQERERSLKRSLARLDHRRPLENWGGASSIGRLDYRWENVRRILWDIQRGTRRRDGDADA
jgi:hypothetical protein